MLRTISLLLCLFFTTAYAQNETEAESSRDYNFKNWRFLMQMNGPANWNASMNAVKPLSEKWAIRFGWSPILTFNNTKHIPSEEDLYKEFKQYNKNKKVGGQLSLGAEYHFLKTNKIDPYIMFGMGVGVFVEKSNALRDYEYLVPDPYDLLSYYSFEKNVGAPQYSFDPFTGFGLNYYFHERVAFGVEYSMGPNLVLLKGESKTMRNSELEYSDGSIVKEETSNSVNRNAFYVTLEHQVGFHIIYTLKDKTKEPKTN